MQGSGKAFQVDGTSAHVWNVVRIEEERALQVKETTREEQRLRISSAHWEEGQTSLTLQWKQMRGKWVGGKQEAGLYTALETNLWR